MHQNKPNTNVPDVSMILILLKYMGYYFNSVIGADIEGWKLDLAKEMGTDVVINTKETYIKQVNNDKAMTCYLNCVDPFIIYCVWLVEVFLR